MWSCAFKGWFFQNGCRCHGNGQNAKKMKNTKMFIAGYSPYRNWWNLIGTTPHLVERDKPKKNRNRLDKLCRSCQGNKKGGFRKKLNSFHQTSWNFVGISTVVCGSFWGVENIQNGGRCHGNQGAKHVKFTPNSGSFWILTQK